MAIDEVVNRATIRFPHQLEAGQVKNLLKYVWLKCGYSVTVEEDKQSSLGNLFDEPNDIDEFEQMHIRLKGSFTKPRGRSAAFSCNQQLDEYCLFSGFRFDTAGYDHGLPEDVAHIIDTVRTHTENYFREHF